MPALNFKSRFAEAVVNGSKPHTIRAWRKRPFKVGDVLSFFTGSRFKPRRIRANTLCTAVYCIEVNPGQRYVILGRARLTDAQVEGLAKNDGFNNADEFFQFFAQEHGQLCGQLIEWNPLHADLSGVVQPGAHREERALGAVAVDAAATSSGSRLGAK